MSNALSNAVSGINNSVARATQAATSIVKASSIPAAIDKSLVRLKQEQTEVAANAKVIKTEQKNQAALLDITV